MKKMDKKEFIESQDTLEVTPGEMLATLRNLQGISQGELAKLTGIAQANISLMERDYQKIGRERAIILARALKVHPSVIIFPNYKVECAA